MTGAAVHLQACLNGSFGKALHPAVPISAGEVARAAAACAAAGAGSIHVHPRDADGAQTLSPDLVDAVVARTRLACGRPVGVSTEASIEPDFERRVAAVRGWHAPDFASVNLAEDGAPEVMRALLAAGVGIEAGVWSVEDAERLAASGLGGRVTRILVEPVDVAPGDAVEVVDEIHRALDRLETTAPRLQHGDSGATWILLADAVRRGLATRIGLEDAQHGPDGGPVAGNADLVRAARALGAGSRRSG